MSFGSLLLLLARAPAGISSLSLHDALPIHLPEEPFEVERLHPSAGEVGGLQRLDLGEPFGAGGGRGDLAATDALGPFGQRRAGDDRALAGQDRKSTRLNSSHVSISYAVLC